MGFYDKVFISPRFLLVMKKEQELRKKFEQYAEKQGFKLNPNKKIVNGIIKGLLKNKQKHGEIYCPCRRVTNNKQKDKKIICPCIFHKQEIKSLGHCLCRLFAK